MPHEHHTSCGAATGEPCACEEKRYEKIFLISAALCVFEVVGGIVSGSFSLLSDSAHVASDGVSSLISRGVARRVRKKQLSGNEEHRLRHRWMRVSGAILLAFIAGIIAHAVYRCFHPEPVYSLIAAPIAAFGILGNRWQLRILRADRSSTANMQRQHLQADLQSNYYALAGTMLAGITALFGLEWSFVFDMIFAVVIAWRIVPDTIQMMMTGEDPHDHEGHGHAGPHQH